MSEAREAIGRFVAAQVLSHRQRQRWSQSELAQKVGVSRQAIFQIESGQLPAFQTLYSLAGAFGVEALDLLPTIKQVRRQ